MPQYKVTGPDGKSYVVNAPDGASQDDVLAYVKQNYAKAGSTAKPSDAQADTSPFGQAVAAQAAQMQSDDASGKNSDGRGFLGNLYDAGNAEMHHLANLPLGLAQLGLHGTAAQAQLLDAPDAVQGKLGDLSNQFDAYLKSREDQYQKTVPNSPGAYVGAGIGEVAPWALGIGEARTAGLLPKATSYLGKLGTLGVEGGVMGLTQPVTSGPGGQTIAGLVSGTPAAPSYASQKAMQVGLGAATGPALKAGIDLGGLLGGGVKNVIQHAINPDAVANANVARLLGDAPDTLAKLQGAANYVPGESPSVAQALQTPEAVQIERSLRNNPATGPLFAAQDNANNQARTSLVNSIAGTDADLEAAKAARRAAVDPFVSQYLTDSRPITRWSNAAQPFDDALSKPMARGNDFQALQDAQKVVQKVKSGAMQEDDGYDALKELGDSVSSPKAQAAFQAAHDAIDQNMVDPKGVLGALQTLKNSPLGVIGDNGSKIGQLIDSINGGTNIRGKIGTDMLDAVRQEASKMLGNANSQSALAYGPAKNSIVNAIDNVAPGYRDYLATYAKASEPINTMQTVGGLLDPNAPGSLNAAGDPQLALARVKQLLRQNADATYPISKDAQGQLENLRDSLLRRTVSDAKISASGPSTAADLKAGGLLSSAVYGPNLGVRGGWLGRSIGSGAGALLGSAFGPVGTGLGAAAGLGISDALGSLNSRVATRVGQKMANARLAADVLQKQQAAQSAQKANLLNYYLYGLPASATTNP